MLIHPPGGRSTARAPWLGAKAERKWCTASLVHPPKPAVADAFAQAEARVPHHRRTWIVLGDGARHQLDLIHAEAARRDVTIHALLDFVHVSEYVWTAEHSFHKPGTAEADAWVATQQDRQLDSRSR
ncbi:hypothetical protein ADK54_02575 [Streptomyces sp. WM6378]|nr:hypothetical protein ADK54_02575 [Streptomyces sp. WM6378]